MTNKVAAIVGNRSDVTHVSRALAVHDQERRSMKGDQSARFSRPATKERILQELSVPSADTSYQGSNLVAGRVWHTNDYIGMSVEQSLAICNNAY